MKKIGKTLIFLVMIAGTAGCRSEKTVKPDGYNAVRINGSAVFVEKALSPEDKARGLMFRTSLATNRGMIFLFDPPETPAFYMKNTAIPLDILFIDRNGTIVTVRQMEPFNERDLHRPVSDVSFALEVNAGWAKRHSVKQGDKAEFLNLSDPGGTNR